MRRAFSLSLADVRHLSTASSRGFVSAWDRRGMWEVFWWWLRTPNATNNLWALDDSGRLVADASPNIVQTHGGFRPSLIIRQ